MDKWIPVNEKLPNLDMQCLVVDADGEFGVGYYRESVKAWDSPNWGWLERKDKVCNYEAFTEPCGIGKVIAWMPLPSPFDPQESEELTMGMTNKELIEKLTENIPTWKLILIDKWTDFKVWFWFKTHKGVEDRNDKRNF